MTHKNTGYALMPTIREEEGVCEDAGRQRMKRNTNAGSRNAHSQLSIEYVPIGQLNPASYNPRRISDTEMAKLKRSIQRWGFVDPTIARRDGTIVGGHQRYEAAKELGFEVVPVVFVDVSDEDAKLLNLALNKISGEWDTMRLASLLSELRTLPTVELELSGFLRAEASSIIRALDWGRRPDPDGVPDSPQAPRTKRGDMWRLNDHLLLCADCSDPDEVRPLLEAGPIALLVSDPPYNVSYDPSSRPGARARSRRMANDCLPDERYRELLERSFRIAFEAATPGAPAYIWHAATQAEAVLAALRTAGWHLAAGLIWVKPVPVFGRGDFHWQHEPIAYAWKPGGRHHWYGGRSQSTVWDFGRDDRLSKEDAHPTQKPVALFERAITNSSAAGNTVFDPFVGSGTAIIACERLARRCLAVEIEPRFVDLAVRRWEHYTGQKAELLRRE